MARARSGGCAFSTHVLSILRRAALVLAAATFILAQAIVAQPPADTYKPPRLPIDFIENRGQWEPAVNFVAQRGGITALFEKHAVTLRGRTGASLRFNFESASDKVRLIGESKRPHPVNFFFGSNPSRWQTNVASYESLLYQRLYPDISLRVREENGQFEHDVLLGPDGDLSKVSVRCDGVTNVIVADNGELILERTDGVPFRHSPSKIWEVLPNGEKRPINSRYRRIDSHRYGLTAPDRASKVARQETTPAP